MKCQQSGAQAISEAREHEADAPGRPEAARGALCCDVCVPSESCLFSRVCQTSAPLDRSTDV